MPARWSAPRRRLTKAARRCTKRGRAGPCTTCSTTTARSTATLAHAETYFEYAGRNRDGSNWLAGGRYVDRLERRGGDWRVAFRMTMMEWSGTIPGNEVPLFEGVEDVRLNGGPARDRTDASYLRPLVNKRALRAPANPGSLSRPKN